MPAGFTGADFYYILPEIVLTVGALLVLVVDLLVRDRDDLTFAATLATIGVTTAVLLSFAGVDTLASRGLLAIDGFAMFFKVVFLLAAAITVLMSSSYLKIEGVKAGEYYFLILCATLGMMFMASGIDLITLFIGLETMAISFYVLAGFLKSSQRSNEAAVKYYLLGAFSTGVLLYGMSLLYAVSGSTNLAVIAQATGTQTSNGTLLLGVILVAAGLGFKIRRSPVPHVGTGRVRGSTDAGDGVLVCRVEGGCLCHASPGVRDGAALGRARVD